LIVVDTSALLAVFLEEREGPRCAAVLRSTERLLISAGTLAEALIVSGRRGVGPGVAAFIVARPIEVVPVNAATAERMAGAYARWGKGVHPAGLNLGDCFAYALAEEMGCPLLFVGRDFARTDMRAAV
jgi:ribonuclease VapC